MQFPSNTLFCLCRKGITQPVGLIIASMDNNNEQSPGLNLHLDQKDFGGVWANFAAIKHSDYEFTIDFARLDFSPDGANGVVVSRVNISPLLVLQLIEALETNWAEYSKKAMPPEVRDN